MAKKRKTVWGVLLGLVVGVFPAWSFELHDTGIKTCYDNAGNLIECPAPGERFYGQDAHYTGAMPSYKDNKDGTVSDRNTRLMWQQKDEFRGIWQEACDYCQALTLPSGSDGYSDWRLPTLQELVSIVDFDKKSSPSINTDFFPDCWRGNYWTSNSLASGSKYAWYVGFDGVSVNYDLTSWRYLARCVRDDVIPPYKDNGDGTVSDRKTGLMWQQNDEAWVSTWDSASNYCKGLNLHNSSDWRLPTIEELKSLLDLDRYPKINTDYFPTCHSSYYWSSSIHAYYTDYAWVLNFSDGDVGYASKMYDYYYVRCVRGVPWEPGHPARSFRGPVKSPLVLVLNSPLRDRAGVPALPGSDP